MVVKAINDGMGHTTDWKVGTVEGTELITIDYEGMYCDEALKAIAEKAGGKVEWWIEGQTVNVCRCEHGEEITLGYGKGLTSLERDTGNTAKFYTRLFPVGSNRNIDAEKYGSPRLMLPGGKKYIEQGVEEYGIYDHYEQEAFSGIYPHRVGTVSAVRSEEVTDDEGNKFTVYYFRDGGLNFDPNLYELAGETKRVSFQTGDLAGLGESDDHYFEVNYDSAAREFELITICLTMTAPSCRAASWCPEQATPISCGTSGCRMSITGWPKRNLRQRLRSTTGTTGWTLPPTKPRQTRCTSRSTASTCLWADG